MPLFEVPSRQSKQADKTIAKRTKKASSKAVTVRGGNGLADKIATIKALVEKNLGKYRDDYQIIADEKHFDAFISKSIKNGVISIDTETAGLDPMQDKLVGLCLYTPGEKAAYVPLYHTSYITGIRSKEQLDYKQVKASLQRVVDSAIDVIMFNAKFDIRFIKNHIGVQVNCTWDCYLAARLLNENEPAGLKQLHKKYILDDKEDAFSFDSLFKGVSFDKVPITTGYLYAAHDAIITYELYEFQKQYLKLDSERKDMRDIASVFFNIEMPCLNVVCEMEDTGIKLDFAYAEKLSEKYNKLLQEKLDAFYAMVDMYADEIQAYRKKHPDNKLSDPINVASPVQIACLLYDVLQIESPDPKSPRGTGEPILQKIDNPIAQAVLEYREVSKLLSTYIDKLPNCVNPKDGRIHCSFNQYGADTGRFSSSDPNLQNIPSHNKDIRKMFVASDGYVLLSSDYSQQEPKVMTQMCQDKKMIKAYQEGKDLYAEIAALSFNTTYDECVEHFPEGSYIKYVSGKWYYGTDDDYDKIADGEHDVYNDGKNRRSQAKSILLGVLYGRGVPSIAEQLGTTTKKAQIIKDSVFKGFPAIPQFEKDSLQMAHDLGYVTTLWGRKRRLPDLQLDEYEFKWKGGAPPDDDPLGFDGELGYYDVPDALINKYLRKLKNCWGSQKRQIFEEANAEGIWIIDNGAKIADAQRQCVNARIQGSAADMTKLAMIKVGNDRRLKELGLRLLVPVHDELIAECPEENMEECAKRFAQLMNDAAKDKLEIPISCDVDIMREWAGEKLNEKIG